MRARLLRGAVVSSLVGLGALALGGCGVPVGGAPTVIANNQINPSALAPPPTTLPQGTTTFIYLVAESGTPTPVPVLVPPDQCTSYQALLTRLVQGPNQDQETDGFFSAIPGGTVVLAVTPRTVGDKPPSGPIVVDFNNSFADVAGTEQVLAVEQIVHTIDVLDAGAEVLFEIDGQPIEVPLQNGAQVPRPVSALDYPLPGQATTTC
jgi:spore germination protein GerM